MILRDRDRAVDPCCDNMVGTGFRWPSAIIFILCFVYFDHNGGSASTRCPRWPRSSTRTASLHGFTKCDSVNKFFFKAKRSFFSVKREMPILFFVNCERTVLFSVKCDLDPPFTTLFILHTFDCISYKLFASYIINVWSCAEILPDSDS